ncbi:hypothetical protein ACWEC4_16975 [Streptomyces sp. NPDC005055]
MADFRNRSVEAFGSFEAPKASGDAGRAGEQYSSGTARSRLL